LCFFFGLNSAETKFIKINKVKKTTKRKRLINILSKYFTKIDYIILIKSILVKYLLRMYTQEARDTINKVVVIYEKLEKDIDKYEKIKDKKQIESINIKNNLYTNRLELETLVEKLLTMTFYGKSSSDYLLKVISTTYEMIEKVKTI